MQIYVRLFSNYFYFAIKSNHPVFPDSYSAVQNPHSHSVFADFIQSRHEFLICFVHEYLQLFRANFNF